MGRKNRKGKNLNQKKISTCEICGGFTENRSKRCGMCLNVIKRAFKSSKVYYDKEEE